MEEAFADLPEGVANTLVIAQRCAFAPPYRKPILPSLAGDLSGEARMLAEDSRAGLEAQLARDQLALGLLRLLQHLGLRGGLRIGARHGLQVDYATALGDDPLSTGLLQHWQAVYGDDVLAFDYDLDTGVASVDGRAGGGSPGIGGQSGTGSRGRVTGTFSVPKRSN